MDVRPTIIPAAALVLCIEATRRGRPGLAGLASAIAVLGRWNYGSVWLVMAWLAWCRGSWRHLGSFVLPAVLLGGSYGLWCWIDTGTILAGPLRLIDLNVSATNMPAPGARTWTYLQNCYWLTPAGLAALVWWLLAAPRLWKPDPSCLRQVSVAAVIAYALPLHFLSLPLPRYCLPVLPVALLALLDRVYQLRRWRLLWRVVLLLTLALLLYPVVSAAHRLELGRGPQAHLAELRPHVEAAAGPGETVYSRIPNQVAAYYLRRRVTGVGVPGDAWRADRGEGFSLPELGQHCAWMYQGTEGRSAVEPSEVPAGALLIVRDRAPAGSTVIAQAGPYRLVRTGR
jgi:hypothetical protein